MNIEALLQSQEGKTLEFKRDLSSPRNLLKSLVAFANTAGGKMIVGVDDTSRQMVGGEHPLDEEERLCSLIADSISPRLVPTKGAVLLFGKERTRHFPDAWVQCGRFIGRDKADIFDHTELYDHLPQAVDTIMLFLKKHAMRGADFSEVRRKDIWSIPLGILREAVINALVHADYSQRGAPVRIAFFDDRIEIENPGILLPGMTIEDMRQGVSKIRNHVIARMFRELTLIEQWGSGVRRIFKEAEEQGLPAPEIVEVGMRMRFIVYLAQTHSAYAVAPQVEKLLYAVIGEMTREELQASLGLQDRKSFRELYLAPALAGGLIEMTIPDKPRSPLQKYRLTAQGRSCLSG